MINPTLVGVDLDKHSFAVCEVNHTGRVLQRHEFKRQAFASYLVQLPAGTKVAMEACGGAHYWARKCLEFGLVPRIMTAQFVKPFRKGKAAKNDRNDAEAITTAARQGNMRKATPEQRWIQALDQRTVYGKALVAIANKHARQIWAIWAHDVDYDPCAGKRHATQAETTAA
ncbi:MAG TPA: transposase [Salinisphaeraceae bacterium]|nr:transposase [Salinisphaeraceae bacterium]